MAEAEPHSGGDDRGAAGPRTKHTALGLFARGVLDALTLPAWVVGFALLGVGSLAREVGFPLGATVLSTVLIWAAPAQVILFGGIAAGTALPLIAVAISLSSIRLLPMTMSIMPLLHRSGQGLGMQLLMAHYVAVTVWTEGLRRLPEVPPSHRLAYFFGFANACMVTSATMTGIGYLLGGALPFPLAVGLLFITPMFFTLALVAGARAAMDWTAIGLGFVLSPISSALAGRDFDLLLTGLVGGSIAYLVGRTRRRKQ